VVAPDPCSPQRFPFPYFTQRHYGRAASDGRVRSFYVGVAAQIGHYSDAVPSGRLCTIIVLGHALARADGTLPADLTGQARGMAQRREDPDSVLRFPR